MKLEHLARALPAAIALVGGVFGALVLGAPCALSEGFRWGLLFALFVATVGLTLWGMLVRSSPILYGLATFVAVLLGFVATLETAERKCPCIEISKINGVLTSRFDPKELMFRVPLQFDIDGSVQDPSLQLYLLARGIDVQQETHRWWPFPVAGGGATGPARPNLNWLAPIDLQIMHPPSKRLQVRAIATREQLKAVTPIEYLPHRECESRTFVLLTEPTFRLDTSQSAGGRTLRFHVGTSDRKLDQADGFSVTASIRYDGFKEPITAWIDWGEGRNWEQVRAGPGGEEQLINFYSTSGKKTVKFRILDRDGEQKAQDEILVAPR